MSWVQKEILLSAKKRGIHLVTDEIVGQVSKDLQSFSVGIAHIFIKHSSASLAINENFDSDVRVDMENFLNRTAPEGAHYLHSCEGPDDMPAHIKAMLLGSSVSVPITDGRLNLGRWQGIYLGEHRNSAGRRSVVVTLNGALR